MAKHRNGAKGRKRRLMPDQMSLSKHRTSGKGGTNFWLMALLAKMDSERRAAASKKRKPLMFSSVIEAMRSR